ncbi:MAG TPA: lysophospholipid acyltransferase family protein [Anaeromyxobacteraceae bacterium]|nr:lysophospholipid acyltransferase family protein [Anaeromyxobacteraceae bacterium]
MPPVHAVLWLFSAVYWIFAVAAMPPLMAVAVAIFLATVAFDRRRVALHLYSCFWGSFYVWMNPLWRVSFAGRSKIPWRGPAVLVANHLSLLDILVLYGLFRPFKWVAKAELFRVPFVGWTLALNDYVAIRRGDRESIRSMMEHCRRHLDAGTPVLIFPEGTRSQDGRLQAFKDGAFRLAFQAGVPVIPVVVSGTGDALPKHGLALRGRMDARVTVLDPLAPSGYASAAELRDAARAAVAAALPEAGPAPAA